MAKKNKKLFYGSIAAVLLGVVIFYAGSLYAEEKAPCPQFNCISSLEDNLRLMTGKTVTVTLNSGASYTGKVKEVKNKLLILEKLSGKSYYDALIRADKVIAVESQVRGF